MPKILITGVTCLRRLLFLFTTRNARKNLKILRTCFIYTDLHTGFIVIWGMIKIAFEYVKKMNQLIHSGFYKGDSYQNHYQITNASFSMIFTGLKQWDSALYYQSLVYKYAVAVKDEQFLVISPVWIGDTYSEMGKPDSAFYYYRLAISNAVKYSRFDMPPVSK